MSTRPGAMVKMVYFLFRVPGLTPRSHSFFEFEFIKPQRQQVRRKPLGPTGRVEMEKGPTGQMVMEKGAIGAHTSDMWHSSHRVP
jgi:hypothetical protein